MIIHKGSNLKIPSYKSSIDLLGSHENKENLVNGSLYNFGSLKKSTLKSSKKISSVFKDTTSRESYRNSSASSHKRNNSITKDVFVREDFLSHFKSDRIEELNRVREKLKSEIRSLNINIDKATENNKIQNLVQKTFLESNSNHI